MNVSGMFNPENRFWSFMEKVMDLCLLGVLWAVCSLPVITAGAAGTAVYRYTLRLVRDEEGYVIRSFFRAFRENFVQATLLWLGTAAALVFLLADLFCCRFLPFGPAGKLLVRALMVCLLLLVFLTACYLFPLISFFRVKTSKAVPDAFVMAVGNLGTTVGILCVYAVFAALTWFVRELFMVWFAFAAWGASRLLRRVFERYGDVSEQAFVKNDETNVKKR